MERLRSLFTTALLTSLALAGPASGYQPSEMSPVLLSFDVETDTDVPALERLNIQQPATYFVTGEFADRHPDLVKRLSEKGTVGGHGYAHSRLTQLSPEALRKDLQLCRMLIEKAAGAPPLWFRSPYLEHDETVIETLQEVGFRYDSSDQERWFEQTRLKEIPVSNLHGGGLVAADYELFGRAGLTDPEVLELLKLSYVERSRTGRPLVLLLHPRIVVEHAQVLWDFIDFVTQARGSFLSFEAYVRAGASRTPERTGVWVDFTNGPHDPDQLAQDASASGLTDIYLMARSPEGIVYYASDLGHGRDDADRFGATLSRLKAAGLRVHAWIAVNMNTAAARKHPEWAMVAQNGTRSNDWLSPFHAEVRQDQLDTVAELLNRYDLDGIHLDYIRFPSLDFDFSERATGAFQEAMGIDLPAPDPVRALLNEYYTMWTDWRAMGIASLVDDIRVQIGRSERDDVELSAALLAQAATSYRVMEWSGQDYGRLAEGLDAVMPMAYFKDEQRPVDWVADVVFAARALVGRTPLFTGIPAYQSPEGGAYGLAEFQRALQVARPGSDGLVAYAYLPLFARSAGPMDMPPGAAGVFRQATAGGSNSGLTAFPDGPAGPSGLWAASLSALVAVYRSPFGVGGLAALVLTAITVATIGTRRGVRREVATESTKKPRAVPGWRELQDHLTTGVVTGPVASTMSQFIRHFDARTVSAFRMAFVLETVADRGESIDWIGCGLSSIPGWRILALRYLEEAHLHGYVGWQGDAPALTEEGRQALAAAQLEGYDADLWRFVEHRLHETLSIPCGSCKTQNLSHWFWDTFDCSDCGRTTDIAEVARVEIRRPDVKTRAYISL